VVSYKGSSIRGFLYKGLLWCRNFSGSCTVTSRNPLIHNGATNGTKSLRFDPKVVQHSLLSRAWQCVEEPLATVNFAEFLFHALQ
jgi:hypothetical protein